MPASDLPALTLVLGGQRSGKSAYAEGLIGGGEGAVYIATCRAEGSDTEMTARIERHRAGRPDGWRTIEAPVDMAAALAEAGGATAVLIDSLGMWLTNVMGDGLDVVDALSGVIDALRGVNAPVVVVSEETGLGIIPDNALARAFIDTLGDANQRIAAVANRVVFVAAGQALMMKNQ